jgi:hypothetical protein
VASAIGSLKPVRQLQVGLEGTNHKKLNPAGWGTAAGLRVARREMGWGYISADLVLQYGFL